MDNLLLPRLTVFVTCDQAYREAGGSLGLTGVRGRYRRSDRAQLLGGLPVVTVWTGAIGTFRQSLLLLDADGTILAEEVRQFDVLQTKERRLLQTRIPFAAKPGTYQLVAEIDGYRLSEQTITVD